VRNRRQGGSRFARLALASIPHFVTAVTDPVSDTVRVTRHRRELVTSLACTTMSRSQRIDGPGYWHHVMNRGIARRVVFDGRKAVRQFLAGVARSVRRGEIEVIAYAILSTHFHLLVRSPNGELSEALRRIQNDYVRWYNRHARRDGALFRGRFMSKAVLSDRYRRNLIRYIDRNALDARIVGDERRYPYGSALAYAAAKGPPWLAREWVEQYVTELTGDATCTPAAYARVFAVMNDDERERMDELLASTEPIEHELVDLVASAPERVRAWMAAKAKLADGGRASMRRTVDAQAILERIRECEDAFPLVQGVLPNDVRLSARVGLLRSICGASWEHIGRIVALSESTARRFGQRHVATFEHCSEYAEWCSRVAVACSEVLTRTVSDTGSVTAVTKCGIGAEAKRAPRASPPRRFRTSSPP
jgi:REP element-mobilizing transposase RayT